MAKHSKRKRQPLRPAHSKKEVIPVNLGELWLRVRSGAANVAGVRYQLAVTALMLTKARAGLGIEELTPEGLEDIDCRLTNNQSLLVQTKERAEGVALFGLSQFHVAVEHVADALRLDPSARFALITDAELTGGLAETGFDRSVTDTLPHVVEKLVRESDPSSRDQLESALTRAHIVRIGWIDVHEQARRQLEESYQLSPAIAEIVYAALLEEVSGIAADQRRQTRDTARRLRPSDLDTLVHRLRQVVDIERIELAEREGLIEPINFLQPLALSPERFLLGIDVEPGHIAAGLDVIRSDELGQIFTGLSEDQYVLVAGPSGAGKSALLWRSAYEFAGRFRVLRLRRVGSQDVAELLRYVEGQRPSPQAPLLICGDDLGRSALTGWEEAVDRLLELPGVYIIGAVRQEDFRSSLLRGRARVVRPRLNQHLAEEVVAQLRQRKVSLALEPDEAFARADGLLMEFLTLLIAGCRLHDIVNAQVEERLAPGRSVEREILRYVTAAHVYAVALPASALLTLVPSPDRFPAALQRLEDEFLVQRVDANHWSGLHELRSRTVTRRLHGLPPPTEGETLARLLPVVGGRDRKTLIVAAALANQSLSPTITAANDLLATERLDAASIYSLLDGFLEAEELIHARACLDFIHRRRPDLDAVSILPIIQGLRDGWMKSLAGLPNGTALDALAAELPARGQSIAAAAATRLSEHQISVALESSPPSDSVELLELLAFLGKRLPISPIQELIARAHRNSEIALATRATAALAQATPESLHQLEGIAGRLDSRLDSIAEYRHDVLNWNIEAPEGKATKATVNVEVAEYGSGKLSDRIISICRMIYEGCPEIEQVNLQAIAADGTQSIHPDGHKAPLRRYVLNPIREIRRNIAFDEALRRLTAADSWSDRLRQQEELVDEIAKTLDEAIPRLLNPHDNPSRVRSWLEGVDRIRDRVGKLPTIPLPPSAIVDRTDKAKEVLDRLSLALTQLGEVVALGSFDNLLGIGSQFQGAFGKVQASTEAATGASAETRDWPIVRRLLSQLEGLRETTDLLAGLLLALQHDRNLLRSVPRGRTESWRDVAARVVAQTRSVLLQRERDEIEKAVDGLRCELRYVRRDRPGQVRLVNDSWLLLCEFEDWIEASERLLLLSEETQLAISFRTYTAAAVEGLVVPIFTRMLGRHEFKPFLYPVSSTDSAALAEEAGVDYLRSELLDETLQVFEAIGEASSLAALYRLRNERFSRESERHAAIAKMEESRKAIEQLGDEGVRVPLREALALVEGELDDPCGQSLAADMQHAVFNQTGRQTPSFVVSMIVAAIDAALREVSSTKPRIT